MNNNNNAVAPFQARQKDRCIRIEEYFAGRQNRLSFLRRILLINLIGQIVNWALIFGMSEGLLHGSTQWLVIFQLLFAFAQAPIVAKRMHDIERSAMYYWLLFIPLYNIYLGLLLLFKPGTRGSNEYGPDPSATTA